MLFRVQGIFSDIEARRYIFAFLNLFMVFILDVQSSSISQEDYPQNNL